MGITFDDYHQWDRLKELANQNYPTFYATNATLSKNDLRSASNAGTLLNDIPLLDVRGVNGRHKHVTFTPSSNVFLLHSEIEKTPRIGFASVIDTLSKGETVSLNASSEALLDLLNEIGGSDADWSNDLLKIARARRKQQFYQIKEWMTQMQLTLFF